MSSEKKENLILPEPFLFNCWKHHLGYIKRQLEKYVDKGEAGAGKLKSNLLLLGESQMDLYTGSLSPGMILRDVQKILEESHRISRKTYIDWIFSPPEGYKTIFLPDGSSWTLLYSGNEARYIHLHPSRHSSQSIRIRAGTLKTLISVAWLSLVESAPVSLETINDGRKRFFDAPPVKSIQNIRGITKYLELFDL
jgi:hypothetical protein